VVAVERVNFVRFSLAHAGHWRVRTLVELALDFRGQFDSLTEVDTTTLKRWATGKGNATKPQMCAAARRLFGVKLWATGERRASKVAAESSRQEDQADAILIAAWALDRISNVCQDEPA
jgi:Holliday junction resolvasome RuvABC endonuclease subunit